MRRFALLAAVAASLTTATAFAGETPSAPDAEVYFINLKDGDTVEGPIKVQFGLSGMGVAPAGVDMGKHRPPSSVRQSPAAWSG